MTMGRSYSSPETPSNTIHSNTTHANAVHFIALVKPWPNGPPNSSQLDPSSTSMELGIVWPPTWPQLAWVVSSWLEFDQAQMFAQLEPSFSPIGHLKPTLAKLFNLLLLCDCAVLFRQLNGFLRAGSAWRYRLATRRCKFWFCNLARVGYARFTRVKEAQ